MTAGAETPPTVMEDPETCTTTTTCPPPVFAFNVASKYTFRLRIMPLSARPRPPCDGEGRGRSEVIGPTSNETEELENALGEFKRTDA